MRAPPNPRYFLSETVTRSDLEEMLANGIVPITKPNLSKALQAQIETDGADFALYCGKDAIITSYRRNLDNSSSKRLLGIIAKHYAKSIQDVQARTEDLEFVRKGVKGDSWKWLEDPRKASNRDYMFATIQRMEWAMGITGRVKLIGEKYLWHMATEFNMNDRSIELYYK